MYAWWKCLCLTSPKWNSQEPILFWTKNIKTFCLLLSESHVKIISSSEISFLIFSILFFLLLSSLSQFTVIHYFIIPSLIMSSFCLFLSFGSYSMMTLFTYYSLFPFLQYLLTLTTSMILFLLRYFFNLQAHDFLPYFEIPKMILSIFHWEIILEF